MAAPAVEWQLTWLVLIWNNTIWCCRQRMKSSITYWQVLFNIWPTINHCVRSHQSYFKWYMQNCDLISLILFISEKHVLYERWVRSSWAATDNKSSLIGAVVWAWKAIRHYQYQCRRFVLNLNKLLSNSRVTGYPRRFNAHVTYVTVVSEWLYNNERCCLFVQKLFYKKHATKSNLKLKLSKKATCRQVNQVSQCVRRYTTSRIHNELIICTW